MEPSRDADDDLRPEYDLSQLKGGVRGKYAHRKRPQVPHGDGYEATSGLQNGTPAQPAGALSPAEVEAFVRRMSDEMGPLFERSVTPITSERDGVADQCGTGTLFRVADVSFLVTAAHVVTEAEKGGYQLSIFDAADHTGAIPLHGRVLGHDRFDVAVWRLPEDVVARLPNRQFLTVHHADRTNHRPERGGIYMGYGYPTGLVAANRAGDRLLVGPFLYIADAHQSETDTLLNYDPKYHLLLDMAPKGVCRPDAGLELPVRLDGMSGASIWQTYYEGLLSKAWTTNDAVVVAVQTGVDRGGTIIKGTRWWVVDKIIRDAYPELERPLSLITP